MAPQPTPQQCCCLPSPDQSERGQPIRIARNFPVEALAIFRDFDDDDVIEIEPPAKRRKHDDAHPIELHQAELVISRKQKSCSASAHSFTRLIDGDCIRLQEFREPTTTTLRLERLEDGPFSLLIDIPKGIPHDISALINFSDSLPRGRQAGRIRLKSELYFAAQSDQVTLRFRFTLLWLSITTFHALRSSGELAHVPDARRAILSAILPGLPLETSEGSPQEFYKSAYSTKPEIFDMPIKGLKADLYPFQRRAVRWLLGREGVRWENLAASAASATVASHEAPRQVPPGFTELQDMHGNSFYASDLLDVAVRDIDSIPYRIDAIKGGILSEEMGLGKTLEMIGLILLHPAPPCSVVGMGDNSQKPDLRRTGATLIITPTTLRAQWVAELKKHAPSLSVMIYQGMKRSCLDRKKSLETQSESAVLEDFISHDVVIMTYKELRAEIHYASPPPDRSRRRERKYTRPLSPLVQCLWWRVCLDEAQEVDSGVSKAAILARTIPRVNAWAITGTPIKDDIMDLKGLLMFLHCEPFTDSHIWGELVRRQSDFHAIFNTLALRHSKQLVREELDLPLQKRYVINIPFNAVEDQYYQRLFRRLVKDCDLNEQGEPIVDDWDPKDYTAVMRNCLDTLRKAALHPHVGAGNRMLPRNPLRTVMQVLDHMLLEAGSSLLTRQRALLVNKITQGQLLENTPRKKEALEIWQQVLKETEPLVKNVRQELHENQKHTEKERKERQKLERVVKAKAAEESDSGSDSDSSSSSATSSLPECTSPADESVTVRLDKVKTKLKSLLEIQTEMQRKLRSLLEIEHKVVFFIGNAYFQIKSDEDMTEPDSEEFKQLAELEDEYYSRAKKIRQEILQEANHKATRMMKRIEARAKKQDFAVIPEMTCDLRPGVETMSIVGRVQVLCETLNDQANLLDEWRERLIGLLCKPLIDEEEEVTGDEYGDSTQVQEEIIVYVQVIRATIADRLAVMSGQQVSKLVVDETRISLAQAVKGKGPAPELLIDLLASRDKIAPRPGSDSIRGFLGELRTLTASLRSQGSGRAQLELSIVEKLQKSLSDQSWDQNKAHNALESEIDKFTTIMNARVDYYRQLQAISDDVSPYDIILDKDGERDEVAMAEAMRALKTEEEKLAQIVEKVSTEHRYLINLKNAGDKEESRICPICQTEITNGVMTMCGHQFDKDCLFEWLKRASNCPTCKRLVQRHQLHPFVLKTRDLKLVDNDGENGDDSTPTKANSGHQTTGSQTQAGDGIYATFNSQRLAQIQAVELVHPSFTTKVDAIVRHILWLRLSEPGAKSIIFSQYAGFFGVLSAAFTKYRIGFSSIGEQNGIERFKQEAGIECFFLHARAQSSGLNLVNANHVILCEPLLNTALELQAIARVDRIGQTQDTTVWLYMVEGTVEPTIYNLSVQRRLEHMDRVIKANADGGCFMDEKAVEAANSLEMQQASLTKLMRKEKGTAAGEEIAADDLWTCIFGHVKKEENDQGEEEEDRLRNDVVVRRRLLGDAVEQRMEYNE